MDLIKVTKKLSMKSLLIKFILAACAILIVILISRLRSQQTYIESPEQFRSSLEIYYPMEKDKQKKDICGQCDGHCSNSH